MDVLEGGFNSCMFLHVLLFMIKNLKKYQQRGMYPLHSTHPYKLGSVGSCSPVSTSRAVAGVTQHACLFMVRGNQSTHAMQWGERANSTQKGPARTK